MMRSNELSEDNYKLLIRMSASGRGKPLRSGRVGRLTVELWR